MSEPLKPCDVEYEGSIFTVHSWSGGNTSGPCDCGAVCGDDRGNIACEHGHQRRKCPHCELVETEKSESALLDLLVRVVNEWESFEPFEFDLLVQDIRANALVKARLEER